MSPARKVRTLPPGPAAVAAAIMLVLSAVFSLILGLQLLRHVGRAGVVARDFGITFAGNAFTALGLLALLIATAKLAAALGVLARVPHAAVLGIVLAGLDAFFSLPARGGRRPLLGIAEMALDAFVIWALVGHLHAMPKRAPPGATWGDFGDRPRP
jgi:hypothetical protein